MVGHVRILVIVMLAAFAAGTVAHAANAAAMNTEMARAAISGMDMGDCQGCPDDGDEMPSCDNICVSPVLGVLPPPPAALPEAVKITTTAAICDVTGLTGPPIPYPPRTTILN